MRLPESLTTLGLYGLVGLPLVALLRYVRPVDGPGWSATTGVVSGLVAYCLLAHRAPSPPAETIAHEDEAWRRSVARYRRVGVVAAGAIVVWAVVVALM